ncbi:MAG TPA: hypothetical protein VGF01_01220 [Terracidiphilus sp.]|jgi:hypothetical protein
MIEAAIGFVLVEQVINEHSTKIKGSVKFEHGNNHHDSRIAGLLCTDEGSSVSVYKAYKAPAQGWLTKEKPATNCTR